MAQSENLYSQPRQLAFLTSPLGVFLIALLLRAVYYLECSGRPWFGWPILDSRYLLAQAQLLATGYGLPPGPLFRPPLYTLLLGWIWSLADGSTAIVASFLQHIIGAGFCALVCATGRFCFSKRAGFVSGLIAAFYAPMIFYEGEILSDSLALFFCGLFLFLWLKAMKSGKTLDFLFAGIAAGLGAVTRPNLILAVAAFAGVYAIRTILRQNPGEVRARRLTRILGFVIPVVVITAIPSGYNAAQGDFNLICSQGGINFWLGNNAESNGTNVVIPKVVEPTSEYIDTVEHFSLYDYGQVMKEKTGVGNIPAPSNLSNFWYKRGFDFLFSQPAKAGRLYVAKTVALVNNYEVRNNKDFFFVRKNVSVFLRMIPFTFGCLFTLAAAGVCCAIMTRLQPPVRWILLFEVAMGAGIVAYFVGGRLRLPFVAGLFPLAGLGVDSIIEFVRAKNWKRVIACMFTAVFAAAISFCPWRGIDFRFSKDQEAGHGIFATSYYPEEYALIGTACLDAGKSEQALQYASKAIKADSRIAYPYLVAGIAELNLGESDNAARHFRRALEIEPNSTRALNNLSVVAEKRNQYQAAVELLSYSIEINSEDAVALSNLAILRYRSGDKDVALALAKKALSQKPGLATAEVLLSRVNNVKPGDSGSGRSKLSTELEVPITSGSLDFGSRRPLSELLDFLVPQ